MNPGTAALAVQDEAMQLFTAVQTAGIAPAPSAAQDTSSPGPYEEVTDLCSADESTGETETSDIIDISDSDSNPEPMDRSEPGA